MSLDSETKEERFLAGQLEDLIRQSEEKYMITASGFLNIHERKIAESMLRRRGSADVDISFYGGYSDAERTVMLSVPEFLDYRDDNPLAAVRVSVKNGGRELRHGDYLGSVLGLGITRDRVGDILVRKNGADIIIDKNISEFLLANYSKAGRMNVSVEEISIDQLMIPEVKKERICDTVMSLRLDNVVSSGFRISRTKAQEAIRQGRVSVDNVEEVSVSKEICTGQKVSCRGKGKIVLCETGEKTRKGRIRIEYDRYI